jgi:hypothetical protein
MNIVLLLNLGFAGSEIVMVSNRDVIPIDFNIVTLNNITNNINRYMLKNLYIEKLREISYER